MIFTGNTNLLTLTGLKDIITDAFINNATVTVTITDNCEKPLEGAGWPVWPIVMEYIASSDGDYRAILVDSLPFKAGVPYEAAIYADGGPNRIGRWRFKFKPEVRRS